ncbi:mechanosensitive ion channel family protein [Colwellia hornerae]|uniref:Mechanosensitive ion channel family protein n=1 Tax=Colwellia hornerae TaxID=89402 RepID=A0A5C6QD53_9GAMM|nr:mechanosensitive ion channel family protein [Colwellia hornerae]TWX58460.1 mechanosensitive ion channel family protein [Colwellia hornerae]TWX58696.1 mechanosensitive ion channel family protein [Colwellia hornerae]TWX66572.1 mechanosensitive ion channel family protein [Colwellia hornerae]
MSELISTWLTNQGIAQAYLAMTTIFVGCMLIFIISALGYYLAKYQVLAFVNKIVSKTKNTWDDALLEHNVFSRFAFLIPLLVLLFLTPILLPEQALLGTVLVVFVKIALSFQIARSISAVLNVIRSLYQNTARERYLPLSSTIQVIKLIIYLVATILAVSFVLDKSPIYLLSGLGALTAVLLLVFQDTIKGLVASIQISANKMVAPGDWIEIPNYGADGDVIDIGLNTVKVKNFDNTVTTVPTYALINGSFKNWRGMLNSGGRRIKRSIIIDINSILFYQNEQIEKLKEISLLKDYLQQKSDDIAISLKTANLSGNNVNSRQLTNVGTFRAYITAYLSTHDKIHHEMTCMVRQLAATESGLPLEIYCFSNDQNWKNYEAIQADIFDHLFAMAPIFSLRVFQHPTGYDWQKK